MSQTVVWISGASSGIGLALVETLPWRDARVIDLSRSGPGDVRHDDDGEPVEVEHVKVDLAERDGWQAAADSFSRELSGFQGERAVFVHAAATLEPIGFAGEVDTDGYAQQVLLNSASPQILGAAFVRAVAGRDLESHLLILTSGAASTPYEGWSAYGAGKAAADQWVRVVGAERERRGDRCRVVAVGPGVVATAMQERIRQMDAENFPRVQRFIDLNREGELREPRDAARGIWKTLDLDLDNGAVVDLRQLGL